MMQKTHYNAVTGVCEPIECELNDCELGEKKSMK